MITDILKTKEAAGYLSLSKPTLDRLRIRGGGPRYCKLGGAVRYRKADLEAWLESHLGLADRLRGARRVTLSDTVARWRGDGLDGWVWRKTLHPMSAIWAFAEA